MIDDTFFLSGMFYYTFIREQEGLRYIQEPLGRRFQRPKKYIQIYAYYVRIYKVVYNANSCLLATFY
ncbi:Uncharacterised protein [uncultured archaeon]|nr:Uncharacterised protein [uncultured archaeon]